MTGQTQEELAHKLDIAVSTVSRWERGETMPNSQQQLDSLARILGIEVWQLFSPYDPILAAEDMRFGRMRRGEIPFEHEPDSDLGRLQSVAKPMTVEEQRAWRARFEPKKKLEDQEAEAV